jgi:hypothetical protein
MGSNLAQLLTRPLLLVTFLLMIFSLAGTSYASPYSAGYYNANVPYSTQTSLAIALGSNVPLTLTPSGSNFSASGSSTVTVTSNDVNGYNLYIYNPSTASLVNGSATIPASSNTTEGPLSTNSWGYNIDGSTNYIGLTTSPVLLMSASGPYTSGNTTTVTFGVLAAQTDVPGTYTQTVTYTAVAL